MDSYLRAQLQYDNQLPPEDDMIDCPECDGEGTLFHEDEDGNGSNDPCEVCKGEGVIERPEHERANDPDEDRVIWEGCDHDNPTNP